MIQCVETRALSEELWVKYWWKMITSLVFPDSVRIFDASDLCAARFGLKRRVY